jgi:hypothetical protein
MNAETPSGPNQLDTLPSRRIPEWLQVVRSQVETLKFGTVQITVHESNVVQIDRVEKTRLERPKQQA